MFCFVFKVQSTLSYLAFTLRTASQSAFVFFLSGTKVFAIAREAGALIKPAVIKWSGGTPKPMYALFHDKLEHIPKKNKRYKRKLKLPAKTEPATLKTIN